MSDNVTSLRGKDTPAQMRYMVIKGDSVLKWFATAGDAEAFVKEFAANGVDAFGLYICFTLKRVTSETVVKITPL